MAGMFDQNAWYTIRFNSTGGNALMSSGQVLVSDNGHYGSAFISPYNSSKSDHPYWWQFYPHPLNTSTYLLRPANTDGTIHLAPFLGSSGGGNCADTCSSTVVGVTNITDDAAATAWIVQPTGDGQTSWLSNVKNMTDWRVKLMTKDDSDGFGTGLNMATAESNTTLMRWQFSSVTPINNVHFSTVAAALSSSSPSSTSPAIPSTTPASNPANKSTNLGAAIGGAVTGLVLLVLLAFLALWYLRRRKAQQHSHEQLPQYEGGFTHGGYGDRKKADGADVVAEAPADNALHEAPQSRGEGMGGEGVNKGFVFELEGEGGAAGKEEGWSASGRGRVVR